MRDYAFPTLNQPVDPSLDFGRLDSTFFNAGRATEFDPKTRSGQIEWKRHVLKPGVSFNQASCTFTPVVGESFPDYPNDPVLPFSISFVTARTLRLRLSVAKGEYGDSPHIPSPMLAGPVPKDGSWKTIRLRQGFGGPARRRKAFMWRSRFGSVTVTLDPWHVEFRDAKGKLLTRTIAFGDTMGQLNSEPTPFSFVMRAADRRRRLAASFTLAPDDKFYGCGESFTRLNKRGQKIVLWTIDAVGAQTREMYKPIPFFLSSRGYGMFVHGSTAQTYDFGHMHDGALVLTLDDDVLDLFVFLGTPAEILSEYTALTGRSPRPPLWSFGLWMSRITYQSEKEVRGIARKLRALRIPSDVIHIDTGWFETDWRCDHQFSTTRFPHARKMLSDLARQGFRVSLWQLPYFSPANALFKGMLEKGYAVLDRDGSLPTDDAIVDFSNPAAAKWYQGLLKGLLEMGVSAIKVDFGEGAPLAGRYASGKGGVHEHNLYPLRYNRAAAEVTKRVTGEWIIWARSAWAGSQRYPVHWGGDAENSGGAMAGTLRAGLSLGLSGFTFWSHDIGGFCKPTPEDVYRRWLPFGMLTSHSRCHGVPPKEPWLFGRAFTDYFRRVVEMKYRLMPYVVAQSADAARRGHPLLRPLFFEYPDDPTSWLIEDEYLFGRDILVAPMMEEGGSRDVYLPPGAWVDYQSGVAHDGTRWRRLACGAIECVILVREGAAIPHLALAQHTAAMDWNRIELVVFGRCEQAETRVCLPGDKATRRVVVGRTGAGLGVASDPFKGRVRWTVTRR